MTDRKVGRPSKYNDEIQEKAESYLFTYESLGHAVPSRVGLCCFIGIHKDTSYEWEHSYPEFSDTLKAIETMQEHCSMNGGLKGELNPTIVKLLLANFGYSDKQQVDHTTKGAAMQPTRIELVAPAVDNSKD